MQTHWPNFGCQENTGIHKLFMTLEPFEHTFVMSSPDIYDRQIFEMDADARKACVNEAGLLHVCRLVFSLISVSLNITFVVISRDYFLFKHAFFLPSAFGPPPYCQIRRFFYGGDRHVFGFGAG
jgi:hypothetical protein